MIAYVTSTRPNFSAVMALDVIRRFADHVPSQRVKQLDLFLHTDSGDSIVPWRLMTYLREYAETIHVLIPHRAFSAGTLTALGADEIVMHPMGMLGPVDPTVHDPYGPRDEDTGQQHGVGVEDVAAYLAMVREDFGLQGPEEIIEAFRLLADRVHPLTLGHVKRGTRQAKMLGEKLLKSRNDPPSDGDIETLLEELTRRLFFHGHPINRKEAAQLDGLPVVEPPPAVETAMWNLYLAYEEDLELQTPFDAVADALDAGAVIPKTPGSSNPVRFPALRRVLVESVAQTDVYTNDFEVTLTRTAEGAVAANIMNRGSGWSIES